MISHRWPFYGQFYPSSTFSSFFHYQDCQLLHVIEHCTIRPVCPIWDVVGTWGNLQIKILKLVFFTDVFHVQTDKFYLTTHCCRSHLHCRFPKIRKDCLHLTPGFSWELMCSSIPNIKCVCKTVYVKLCM